MTKGIQSIVHSDSFYHGRMELPIANSKNSMAEQIESLWMLSGLVKVGFQNTRAVRTMINTVKVCVQE
jgi:acetylornithine/succinyldiaminopimelate/putrescine aminotransferase